MRVPVKKTLFYGWIVVIISFITLTFMGGARHNFSVFYVPLFNEFGWSRAETAIIASMRAVVLAAVAPIMGALLDKYGPRIIFSIGGALIGVGFIFSGMANSLWQLTFTYGIVAALGIAAITTAPNSVIISQWFKKKRGTAMGLATAGVALGSFFNILDQYLIDLLSWREAIIIHGIFTMIIVIPLNAIFQRMRPEEKGLLPDGEPDVPEVGSSTAGHVRPGAASGETHCRRVVLRWLFKNYRFWALFFGSLFMGIGLLTIATHTIAFSVDSGLTAMSAASAIAIGGSVMGFAARMLSFVADKWGREKVFTACTVIYILSVWVLLQLPSNPYVWVLYLYAFLSGAFSLNAAIFYASIGDIFPRRHLGLITGMVVVGLAIGEAIGPTFGGYIFDVYGSYTAAFVSAMFSAAILCAAIWIAAPRHGPSNLPEM